MWVFRQFAGSPRRLSCHEVNHTHWGLTSPESWVPRPNPDAGPERLRKVHTVRCHSIKCELLQVNLSAREGTHSPGEEKAWTRSRTNLSRGPALPEASRPAWTLAGSAAGAGKVAGSPSQAENGGWGSDPGLSGQIPRDCWRAGLPWVATPSTPLPSRHRGTLFITRPPVSPWSRRSSSPPHSTPSAGLMSFPVGPPDSGLPGCRPALNPLPALGPHWNFPKPHPGTSRSLHPLPGLLGTPGGSAPITLVPYSLEKW